MITLHVVEHEDYWYIWKEKTNKHEKLKEKEYIKEKHFGELMYIIAFLGDFYKNFNFWHSDIMRGDGDIVRVIMRP